ncbi:hypothetical protein [Paraburkholderia sp.]|uniref:hypothetical protein n=1 Tax=Paraburkholderia sp. TaxID=1926495 RepID=UPI0023953D25|nr:hypothetical protein [Paraburkholderia sp.]MDE1179778.1 hypothetical protein [Paraburkholderia sp.]
MARHSAVALLVMTRKSLFERVGAAVGTDRNQLEDRLTKVEQLVLDVRACRVDSFEMPTSLAYVTISAG